MKDGEILRLKIRGSGMTVEQAAKRVGLVRKTLYNYFKEDAFDDILKELFLNKLNISFTQNEQLPENNLDIIVKKELPEILSDHEGRLLRLEGHVEVFGYEIATIKAVGDDIEPELEILRNKAIVVIKRKLTEQQMTLF